VDDTNVGCGGVSVVPPPDGPFTRVGSLVVSTSDTTVFAYPLADCGNTGNGCRTAWSTDLGSTVSGPAVALPGNLIAVGTAAASVVVLDGTTGAIRYTDHVGAFITSPVAATNTTVFVAGFNGTLVAFPAGGCGSSSCTPSWTASVPGAEWRPSIGGDVVYVGSIDGTVTALNANGCGASVCSSLWSAKPGDQILGPASIASGHIVVGSNASAAGEKITVYELGS
jgi:hypothetical protein